MEVYGQHPGWPPESLAYFTNQDSRGVRNSYEQSYNATEHNYSSTD